MTYLQDVSIVALPIPAVIMTVVSFRGLIIAIINFTMMVIVFMSVKRLEEKLQKKPPKVIRAPDFGYERQYPPGEMVQRRTADHISQAPLHQYQQHPPPQSLQKSSAPVQNRSRYEDVNPHPYQYDNHTYQSDNQYNQPVSALKAQPVLTTERRFLEPLKGGESEDSASSRASPANETSRDSSYVGYGRIPARDSRRPKEEDPHPAILRHTKPAYGGSLSRDEKPVVRKTYSDANRFSQQQVPPEELRSQLPWSYFQSRHEVKRPKKIQEHSNDEIPPPVPVPDYTLHFPKKGRQGPPPPPKPTKESIERKYNT